MPVGYGIMKLQISCVVEDDKVGTEFLEEEICNFDDLVSQSMLYNLNLMFMDSFIFLFIGSKCRYCSFQ